MLALGIFRGGGGGGYSLLSPLPHPPYAPDLEPWNFLYLLIILYYECIGES